MVSRFDIKKGLGLVLPPTAELPDVQKVKLKDENITKVLINKEGKILLKTFDTEETVQMNQLEAKIKRIVSGNPDMVISLKTDRKAKYQYMVMALDRLQAAGAEKISLSTN